VRALNEAIRETRQERGELSGKRAYATNDGEKVAKVKTFATAVTQLKFNGLPLAKVWRESLGLLWLDRSGGDGRDGSKTEI